MDRNNNNKKQKTNAGSRKIHKGNRKVRSFLPELIQKQGIINKETYNRIQHYSIETCVLAYLPFFEDKS